MNNELNQLTSTELQVLYLIARNKTSKEIAETMFISYRTVQNHRYNITQKLNLRGPNSLLEYAIQNRDKIPDPETSGKPVTEPAGNSIFRPRLPGGIRFSLIVVLPLFILILLLLLIFSKQQSHGNNKAHPGITSVHRMAIMPVSLIGNDSTDLYLADGLTEELINQVSGITNLGVIARSSVMNYRNRNYSLSEIRDELLVDAILEGAIQRQDSLLRINLRLAECLSGETIWQSSYDTNLGDLLKIQQEIARDVATSLNRERYMESLAGNQSGPATTGDVQLDYIQGRYYLNRKSKEGLETAITLFRTAILKDSLYAPAWAGLASAYSWMSNFGYLIPDSAYQTARMAAEKALVLNPNISEAHAAIGAVHLLYNWDFPNAGKALQTALDINPGNIYARQMMTLQCLATGNASCALEHAAKIASMDPLSSFSNAIYGRTLYFTRNYEQSEKQLLHSLELDPGNWLIHAYLGETQLESGNNEAAIVHLEEAVRLSGSTLAARARLAYGYARTGENQPYIDDVLNDFRQDDRTMHSMAFQSLLVYAALGNYSDAFYWMQIAYDARHDFMLDLPTDPKLDPLRKFPKFKAFSEKMKFH